jgi:putative glutamine transport system substrate-binding protein
MIYKAFTNGFFLTGLITFFSLFSLETEAQEITGDSWQEVEQNGGGEITLLYYEEDGFAYTNEQGELTGVEIDIFQQFIYYLKNAKDINVDVNYVGTRDWGSMYDQVQNGSSGVFGIGNVTITDEREQEIDFSPPYLTNIAVLLTHESVDDLSSMGAMPNDFSDMSGVVFEGTTHEERMRKIKQQYYPGLNMRFVNSDTEVVNSVAENTDTFGYVDLSIYWLAEQQGRPIKRHPVGDQASENFGIIMPEGTDWDEPMQEFFSIGNGYRATSAYRNILVKHLGAKVTQMLELARRKNNN